jgi:hypothetical protein
MTITRMIGTAYATACAGRTAKGLPCKRNTYVLVNGTPFCSVHESQGSTGDAHGPAFGSYAWTDRHGTPQQHPPIWR